MVQPSEIGEHYSGPLHSRQPPCPDDNSRVPMPRIFQRPFRRLDAWVSGPKSKTRRSGEAQIHPLRDIPITAVYTVAALLTASGAALYDAHVGSPDFDPVTAVLIGLTAALACLYGAYILWKEDIGPRWAAASVFVHIPLLMAPVAMYMELQDLALAERGVTESCEVAMATPYGSGDDGGMRHDVACSGGMLEYKTDFEDRLAIGSTIEVIFDPENRINPAFHEAPRTTVGSMLTVSAVLALGGMAIRLVYLYIRRWIRPRLKDDRKTSQTRRRRARPKS